MRGFRRGKMALDRGRRSVRTRGRAKADPPEQGQQQELDDDDQRELDPEAAAAAGAEPRAWVAIVRGLHDRRSTEGRVHCTPRCAERMRRDVAPRGFALLVVPARLSPERRT